MELRVGHVLDAYLVLRQLILERRPFPTSGAYRLARLHAVLEPEAILIEAKRAEIVKALAGEEPNAPNGQWQVPPEKMPDYKVQWTEMANQKIDVNCQAIQLRYLGDGPAITTAEFLALGSLILDGAA